MISMNPVAGNQLKVSKVSCNYYRFTGGECIFLKITFKEIHFFETHLIYFKNISQIFLQAQVADAANRCENFVLGLQENAAY